MGKRVRDEQFANWVKSSSETYNSRTPHTEERDLAITNELVEMFYDDPRMREGVIRKGWTGTEFLRQINMAPRYGNINLNKQQANQVVTGIKQGKEDKRQAKREGGALVVPALAILATSICSLGYFINKVANQVNEQLQHTKILELIQNTPQIISEGGESTCGIGIVIALVGIGVLLKMSKGSS